MTIVNNVAIFYTFNMISYEPFWQTLKDRGETTYTLINKYGISSGTIDRIRKNGGITTAKIDDLCKILHCKVQDVIEYIEVEYIEKD